MTRTELIDIVAGKILDLKKGEIEAVVVATLSTMVSALARHERIELRGLGVFTPVYRKGRMARNPRTGAPAEVRPRWNVKFTTASALKAAL